MATEVVGACSVPRPVPLRARWRRPGRRTGAGWYARWVSAASTHVARLAAVEQGEGALPARPWNAPNHAES